MKRRVSASIALVFAVGCAQGIEIPPDPTTTYRTGAGERLTPPSSAPAAKIVGDFLRGRGATVEGLVQSSRRVAETGLVHLRFEQRLSGLRVHGAYVKATVDEAGRLVHLIDGAARPSGTTVAAAALDAREALQAALAAFHPRMAAAPAELRRDGHVTTFAKGSLFYSEPTVERVLVVGADGGLDEAFAVETWTLAGNELRVILVGGTGTILDVEERTANDVYNVFPIDPARSPQEMIEGPGTWLDPGEHWSQHITGNNVAAYADANGDGFPDLGGRQITDGVFAAVFDPLASPDVEQNRDVAVQNLFYLNNRIHDTLYAAGFDEAAGNFQQDNFGLGGLGGDPVNAEAQDGSGTNNANFSTPTDGRRPRMQMYLWTTLGDNQVVVHAPAAIAGIYRAQGGVFAPPLSVAGTAASLVAVDDGSTGDGTGTAGDGCEPLSDLSGTIALVERGLCPFVQKVKNAQTAGAAGVIVANNQGGDALMVMGGSDPTITIPATFVSQNAGAKLKSAAGVSVTIRLTDPPLVALDGDLDSDIVWHEYGHGLTWRMIGGMSGRMSGAIGEGMGDVLAIIANEDDAVGEYSAGDPRGIRTGPYGTLQRTYADFKGTQVHFDGEMYGAIGWKMLQGFRAAGVSKDVLLGYLVDGMNYTKPGPAFEDMRDGILQAAAGTGHECLIWKAFAAHGVGVGARGVVRGPRVWVNDSKDVPAECR